MSVRLNKIGTSIIFSAIVYLIFPQMSLSADYTGKVGYLVKNAEIYSRQGNHTMALMMYDQAIRAQPNDLELYYQRAKSYGLAGYYQNAIKDLSLIISRDEVSGKSRYPSARKFRAECFAMLGYFQKAVEDYKYMLRENELSDYKSDKIAKIWYYLAEVYAVSHRTDLAMSSINNGLLVKSHWSAKLKNLQERILTGQTITLHKPYTN